MPIRALEVVAGRPWAILPEALSLILELAGRERLPTEAELLAIRETRERREALAAEVGKPLDGAPLVRVRDGVGVLPIFGPLVPRADLFDDISGAVSVEKLARSFSAAAADPNVRGLLLHVDSPGGDVTDIGEFAAMIRRATEQKPVWAYVSGLGASAAYWISAGAQEIVASPSALLGSIGVYSVLRDTRGRDEKAGVREWEFVSSQSPKKRPDPATEAGSGQIQAVVDEIGAVFVASVADLRGVSAEKILADYGAGAVLVGERAKEAGLCDRIGDFEGTLAALAAQVAPTKGFGPGTRGKASPQFGAERKGRAMEEQQDTAAELQAAQERIRALERDLTSATTRAEAAEGLADTILGDLQPEIVKAGVRAGMPEKLVSRTVEPLTRAREWGELKSYWADCRAEVERAVPVGTSADRKAGTAPQDEEEGALRARLAAKARKLAPVGANGREER
jgi:signal peptide peptidase SppA